MDEKRISYYIGFLNDLYLFSNLMENQIADLLRNFEEVEYNSEECVYEQGDRSQYFYIIIHGYVNILRIDTGEEKLWGIFNRGEYFGEESLLLGKPRLASARVNETTRLLRLPAANFFEILQKYPGIRSNLIATIESRQIAKRKKFDWLSINETVYFIARKNEFFLYRSLIIPIIIALLAIPAFVFGTTATGSSLTVLMLIASMILTAGGILWGLWNYLDWGNDFYIVTNQRVVWLEQIVGLYSSRREAPLTTILAVNVTSSQLGRLLNFGNVDVRTYTGSIFMRNVARPNLFASFVKGNRSVAGEKVREEKIKAFSVTLRDRLGISPEKIDTTQVRAITQVSVNTAQTGSFKERWRSFFKVRYEKDGVITYRKYWLILFQKTLFPTITFMGLMAFSTFLIVHNIVNHQLLLLAGKPWIFLIPVLVIINLIWWSYHYLDWRNDIYQLTPDQILDLEKKPLGKEDKKTALLDSILSIEHTRNGILELLLNFGNVTINVGQTEFVFRGVFNPDQVHQDVADYMEARKRRSKENEAAQEREFQADMFKAYHDQIKNMQSNGNK